MGWTFDTVKGGSLFRWVTLGQPLLSTNQLHRLALLLWRDGDVSLGRAHLPMPSQLHDGLDAYGMVCQGRDVAPAPGMASRTL